jgi:hypothetical protein
MLKIEELLSQGHSILEARILFRIYEIEGARLQKDSLLEHGQFVYTADTIKFRWRGRLLLSIVNSRDIDGTE